MAWYSTGTLTLVNGSTTVVGVGTDFISGANVGEALYLNDNLYEIGAIVSATQLTLVAPYLGSTDTGVTYKIIPTQSLVADLAAGVSDLITDYSDVKDTAGEGKFNDGTVTAPGITFEGDQNTGIYKIDADNFGLTAGGIKQIDVSSSDVELNHSGNKKLATTSTGVDVTGTVTADGLTVDGSVNINATFPGITFTDTNGGPNYQITAGNGYFRVFDTTNSAQRFRIGANGDAYFYEDTGTTAKMVWDASAESLGIGTSSPSYALDVAGRAGFGLPNTTLPALGDDTANFRIGNLTGGNINYGTMFGTLGTGDGYIQQQRFDGNATAYDLLLQPNGGNLGIGTDSPSSALHISNSTPTITLTDSDASGINSTIGGSSGRLTFDADADNYGTGEIYFKQAGSERARIDSSGNLLVGTTDSAMYNNSSGTSADAGVRISPLGFIDAAAYQNTVGEFNRTGNDGSILNFRKDGSTVGSIGTIASDLTIGVTDTGLQFRDYRTAVTPFNITSNTSSDGVVSLGWSDNRFKDLYLSGGVYLGGTGSANKLDDYETGDFTPIVEFGGASVGLTYTAQWGRYTKIGNTVTFQVGIDISDKGTSTGSLRIQNLPFTSATGSYHSYPCSVFIAGFTGLSGAPYATIQESTSQVRFYTSSGTGTQTAITDANASSGYFMVTGTYRTNS
jgi:hypothetical protein